MASNSNRRSPATEVEEITLSSDSEVEEENERNLAEDSESSSPPTPPLPSNSRSNDHQRVTVKEEASPPAANIATSVSGCANPTASTSMNAAPVGKELQPPPPHSPELTSSASLSSSLALGSLSFAELRVKLAQLEESERAAHAKLKICEAENAQMKKVILQLNLFSHLGEADPPGNAPQMTAAAEAIKTLQEMVADSQTKLAALTERLQEAERKSLEMEADCTAKVDGFKEELQQVWNHLTTILERSDMDKEEVAGVASEEKDALAQVTQTIAKLEAEWDANAEEAKKDTLQLQRDILRTNEMVYEIIQMMNTDEDDEQEEPDMAPPLTPQSMEVDRE